MCYTIVLGVFDDNAHNRPCSYGKRDIPVFHNDGRLSVVEFVWHLDPSAVPVCCMSVPVMPVWCCEMVVMVCMCFIKVEWEPQYERHCFMIFLLPALSQYCTAFVSTLCRWSGWVCLLCRVLFIFHVALEF